MRIRDYKSGDAAHLARIFHDAVHEIGKRDYSEQQVKAWSPAPASAERFAERSIDGRMVFVAVDENDRPAGFIELEQDGHIDCFYCRPDVAGTGVGKKLHDRLERRAWSAGIPRLFVEASEAARRSDAQRPDGEEVLGESRFH